MDDFDKASNFKENSIGFPMIYKFNDDNGQHTFTYSQINQSTFIELMLANGEHPE